MTQHVGNPLAPQIWRVSSLGRFGVLALVPLAGLLSWLALGSVLASALAIVGALLSWWRFAWRPAVILTDTEVILRNPNASQHIALRDVRIVDAGYGGLTITTSTNERVVAWAVQKSNLAKWTGRHTRADDVAASITRASRSYAETS
ncbi:PH domain-containing protein [Micromonospora sp. NPDC005553]|uniref:PH domain-containing protein n=1 Tax=unclassified Micromonospora TaxID=2617518 RepID=UPI0033ACB78D